MKLCREEKHDNETLKFVDSRISLEHITTPKTPHLCLVTPHVEYGSNPGLEINTFDPRLLTVLIMSVSILSGPSGP